MREVFENLAEQAMVHVPGQTGLHTRAFSLEKFAELIVKECASICYHHSEAAGGVDTAFGYGYKDCGNDIKKHFGVEE